MGDREREYLFVLACLLGLCAASLAQSYLYRRLRADVDFLTVLAGKEMTTDV